MKQLTLLIFLFFAIFRIQAQDLRITEIMYNPANSEPAWEWVEVYNAGTEIVDLAGYVLDDFAGAAYTESNILSGSILPGNSAILYNASSISEAEFLQAWGNVDLIAVTRWSAFNNGGDTIGIWNSFESYSNDLTTQTNAIEQITYAADGEIWPEDNGSASIYLVDLNADRAEGGNWDLSSEGVETPLFISYASNSLEEGGSVDIGSPGVFGVVDIENPIIVCPDSLEMVAAVDNCGATVVITLPTATDNISTQFEFEGIRSDDLALTEPFPIGSTTITWTAIDESGNRSNTCEQSILVTSDVLPILNCPSAITAISEDGDPVIVDIAFATVSTVCDQEINLSFTRSDDLGLQEAFPIGETTITWRALDASGQEAECTQLITITSNDINESSENAITSFLISEQLGETSIDFENKTVSFVVPFWTNVSMLTPNIEVSEGAEITPMSDTNQDFTNSVIYIVTAENGTESKWTVTAEIEEEESDLSITSFILVNAETNQDLFLLEEGMRLDIASLPTQKLDIRVTTSQDVESVSLSLAGAQTEARAENIAPYALFGDAPTGDYNGNNFEIGNYTLLATPYEEDNLQGAKGEGMQISFELFEEVIEPTLFVTEFILVNADTNEDIFALTEGMQIDLSVLPTLNLDIRASTSTLSESVRIELSGDQVTKRTENLEPYALFGDLPAGNYNGNNFVEGKYVISAIAYSEDNLSGDASQALTVNFEIYKNSALSILQFVLVNADTNEDLLVLTHDMEIDLNSLPTLNLNIRADTEEEVLSVGFTLSGAQSEKRTENVAPYALFGDFPANNYLGNSFLAGDYSIAALGYSELQLEGENGEMLFINFKIIDTQLSAKRANDMNVYPNPVSSVATIKLDIPETLEIIYLYDSLGREVGAFNAAAIENDGSYMLNMDGVPEGMFYLKSFSKNGSYTKQIMIKN